jgi:hypothetical protein
MEISLLDGLISLRKHCLGRDQMCTRLVARARITARAQPGLGLDQLTFSALSLRILRASPACALILQTSYNR